MGSFSRALLDLGCILRSSFASIVVWKRNGSSQPSFESWSEGEGTDLN